MKKSFWLIKGSNKYYFGFDGKRVTGRIKIGDDYYFFNTSNGKMFRGWKTDSGRSYYYQSDGKSATGSTKINGVRYTFDSTGVLFANKALYEKANTYSSNTRWLILLDTNANKVSIFYGNTGDWELVKYWSCTTGAYSTPTVKGVYTVGAKGMSFGKGYTCWYYTQFYGDYLFHSVLYEPGSMTRIQDGRLGINASHGCVRLDISNAKWIYDNIPASTKVVSY